LYEKVLGRTGLKVKTLGFGGIPIQPLSEEEAIRIVRKCYDLGMNYYDTARMYSNSEERIGKALEDVRENVYLATKSLQRKAEGIKKDFAVSVKNLRTDYIDVYQLHNISTEEEWEQVQAEGGALEAVYELKEQDKINHISVTSHSPDLAAEMIKSDHFSTVMIPYNFFQPKPADMLLPLCQKLDVGTIIMKPFGGGAISDAYTALKYVYNNPDTDLVIPGVASIAEVEENNEVWQGDWTLSQEERALIENDEKLLGEEFRRARVHAFPKYY